MSTPSHPQVNRGTTVAAPRPLRLPVAVHNVRAVVQQPIILATLLGLLSLLVTMMALAQPWRTSIIVGSPFDRPYLREFYHAEYSEIHQSGFRWTQPVASVILQGLDQGTVVVLHVHGDYDGMPLGIDNGAGMQTVALRPGWQQVYLLPRVNAWNGNTFIRLNAPAQFVEGDPRARGVAVRQIDIRGNGAMPPLGQAVLLALSTALATLLMGRATHRTWMGALVGLSLALGVGAVLTLDEGYWRLTLTNYTGRLLVVLLLGGLVLLAAEWLLACLVQRGIIRLGPGARRGLAAAALLAFVMRFGAAAYPLNYNSDLPLILGRTWLVREGQLLSIFLPNPALTPVQWEMDVTIPRSPFYYIITTPVTLLPSRYGDELGMLAFSSVVDAVAVLLVGMLVLALGGNGRAAVYGGLLAAALPFGLRMMVSWGILPTLLAQCLSLLAVMVWLHLRPRLHKRWAQLVLGVCLAVAFIAYPTALAFLGTTGALLIALLALRRDPATLPTLWAGIGAVVVAFALFYGWHVPALLSRTLPELAGAFATELPGTVTEPTSTGVSLARTWGAVWGNVEDWYSGLVLALAGCGALLLTLAQMRRPPTLAVLAGPNAKGGYARLVLLCWCVAYIPFAFADEYVVTLILKQVLHLLPALAVLGGLVLGRIGSTWAGRLVAAVALAWVGWEGLLTLIDLVVYGFYQLK